MKQKKTLKLWTKKDVFTGKIYTKLESSFAV